MVLITRFLRRILRALSNLLGIGLDEEEMLGIKHHKKKKSSSSSSSKGGGKGSAGKGGGSKGGGGKSGGGGKGGRSAAARERDDSSDSDEDDKPIGVVKKSVVGGGKRSFKGKGGGGGGGGDEASHKLHINTLKGHTDTVNMASFSGDGKAVVTACDDMTVRLFRLGEAVTSKNPHILRIPLDKERATGVVFSSPGASGKGASDGIVTTGASPTGETSLTRYAISATTAPEVKYEKKRALDGMRSISLACGGGGEGVAAGAGGATIRVPPIVVSSSDETELRVWAVDTGAEIARLDTLQFKNHNAAVSPDGRFVAAACFTADVKIWEVLRSKERGGVPVGMDTKNASMLLKGHKGAVQWVAFTQDAKGVVTVSKDKTMKLWNIDVRYGVNEDPKVIASMDISRDMNGGKTLPTRVAVSPRGVIAVVMGGTALVFYEMGQGVPGGGRVLERVEGAHGGEEVTWMEWSRRTHKMSDAAGGGEADVLVTSGADRKAKLWRAPPGA